MTVRLSLGTAQWGAGYGVTNRRGRLSDAELADIVEVASAAGITCVDTAAGYGDAQERLRQWAPAFDVTTKVAGADPVTLVDRVEGACAALGRATVDALLLHDWDSLDAEERQAASRELEACRADARVTRVGVSAYDAAAVADARDRFTVLGQVQVPANALDRRLDDSTVLRDLAERGVRVQVRSAFLQGLLLDPHAHPLGEHPAVVAFHAYCAHAELTPLEAALAHVRALPWATDIVVGVTSAGELRQIVDAWNTVPATLAPENLACMDAALIDPRLWPR